MPTISRIDRIESYERRREISCGAGVRLSFVDREETCTNIVIEKRGGGRGNYVVRREQVPCRVCLAIRRTVCALGLLSAAWGIYNLPCFSVSEDLAQILLLGDPLVAGGAPMQG